MDNPLISVIVPVYNVERYLDRCVQSVLDQDYSNFELLLIDDGSPDHCGEMCDAWEKKDRRIRVFHKKNGGQSSARNMGLDNAMGQFIAFVDSDDWVSADYLSYMFGLLPADASECGITACNHMIVRNGRATNACDIRMPMKKLSRIEAFNNVLFHGCMDVAPWGKLYTKEIFNKLRYPEGRLFEDTWLFGDVLKKTWSVVFGNKPCYYYEMHEESTVNQSFRAKNLEYVEAAEKLATAAVQESPANATGAVRRVNHARLSVLRYMENCDEEFRNTRAELRRAVLEEAPRYIKDPRTPMRDKLAVTLLRMGFGAFYRGWRAYTWLRK